MSKDIASPVEDPLRASLLSAVAALGPGDDLPNGTRRLDERTYPEIKSFKVLIRANESQHRGRPHCCVQTDKGDVSVDIETGQIIAGDAGKWNTPIKRAVVQHREGLKALWEKMRPDDQRLPPKVT